MEAVAPDRLLIIIAFLIPLIGQFGLAQDPGVLLGRVLDPDGRPVANAVAELTSADGLLKLEARSTSNGSFGLVGIPPGKYTFLLEHIGYRASPRQGITFEASAVLYVRVVLATKSATAGPDSSLVWTDLTDDSSRTLIDDSQVQSMPSANNIWSLIENQDFSATTNRIDVGGVWATLPALWSSRGSVSWTQSSYLMNGLEATDPYATGTPLYYPDLEALQFAVHSNGRHPVDHLSPGGTFDFVPKQGTDDYHGAFSAFFTGPGMTSHSIPTKIREEGLSERTRLNSFEDYSAQFSGPILPGKLHVFASLSYLNVNRDVAEFEPDDRGTVSSALVNLTYRLGRSSLQFFWTGQAIHHPTDGAARGVPFSATLDQRSFYNVLQLFWRTRLRPGHHFEIGAAFNKGNIHSQFQDAVTDPYGLEVFKKIPSGAAPLAGRDDRTTVILQGKGQALLGGLSGLRQRIDYGLSFRYAGSTSAAEILDNIHLHYAGDEPFEIVRYNTPVRHEERSFDTHFFVEDSLLFPNLASLSLGLHLVSTRGRVPGIGPEADAVPRREAGKIDWLNVAPRLSFGLPFLGDKSMALRVSAGRYYFHLPLQYLSYGNPRAIGGLVYRWTDSNNDGRFQPDEEGKLWRREGPLYAEIDPEIKRPYTDEFSVSLTKIFHGNLYLTLAGFYRETRHLVETLNIGVPLTAYTPVEIYDPGDDTIPGTPDDLYLTVYNQDRETLGNDLFVLTNPDEGGRVSRYRGLDLSLVKKFGSTVFFFAATATEAIGTSSPGNTEYENDDGVIGSLYDNPNAFIFAKGRLRFDRAYVARLGASFNLPFGFRLAGLAKYYDGQPFSRKIIVTGLNQGPFYVQAFPRGVARYEFNMTVGLRLEKAISLGSARGRVFLDAYNIFNWALATQENEWTGPEFPLRYATEILSPRVIRLGMRYEF